MTCVVQLPNGRGLQEYPSRAAWLADARHGPPDWSVGGTTAADIMGVGFGGPWAAWAAGQGTEDDREPSDRMIAGSEWEPLVLRWYAAHHNRPVASPLCRVADPAAPWLRPSPDGFALDALDGPGLVEVKCPRRRDGWGPDGGVVHRADAEALAISPPGYLVQVYVQLAASGLPWCDIIACFGPQDCRTIRVLADPDYQRRLVAALSEWRERHLVLGEPPEVDPSAACSAFLTGIGRDGVRPATEEEADLVVSYAKARSLEKCAEAHKREAAAALLALMGGAKTIIVDLGSTQARFTAGSRGPVLSGLE